MVVPPRTIPKEEPPILHATAFFCSQYRRADIIRLIRIIRGECHQKNRPFDDIFCDFGKCQ